MQLGQRAQAFPHRPVKELRHSCALGMPVGRHVVFAAQVSARIAAFMRFSGVSGLTRSSLPRRSVNELRHFCALGIPVGGLSHPCFAGHGENSGIYVLWRPTRSSLPLR
jgi:hypothetical protein